MVLPKLAHRAEPRVTYRINDIAYVKACMEKWGRSCFGSHSAGTVSMTGKLMLGIKSNVCPKWLDDLQAGRPHDPLCPDCEGTGRVKLEAVKRSVTYDCPSCRDKDGMPKGEVNGRTCVRCRGSGKRHLVALHINPAGIRSTRYVGGAKSSDLCTFIHDLVIGWRELDATFWLNQVSVFEYLRNGTQEAKARQLRISRRFYCRNLNEAHYLVERMLEQKMP